MSPQARRTLSSLLVRELHTALTIDLTAIIFLNTAPLMLTVPIYPMLLLLIHTMYCDYTYCQQAYFLLVHHSPTLPSYNRVGCRLDEVHNTLVDN
jgi:hypothetical protein